MVILSNKVVLNKKLSTKITDKGFQMSDKKDSNVSSRRKALAAGAVGVVAWKTPVLNAVVTPAHAQTSVTTTTLAPTVTTTLAPTVMQVVVAGPAADGVSIEF